MKQKINPRTLTTYSDFVSLSEGIETVEDFIDKYGMSIYEKFLRLRQKGIIDKNTSFPITKRKNIRESHTETLDEVQKIIQNNNIESSMDLRTFNNKLYSYCLRKGYLNSIVFSKPRHLKTSAVETIEDLKQYIKDHGIISRGDLREQRPKLYYKFKYELDEIEFPSSQRLSSKEVKFVRELFKYNVNFSYQFEIPGSKYRYDFYLKDYNVVIEVHGRQHFNDKFSEDAWEVDYSMIERDKEKRILLDKLNIPVYYFTYDKFYYNKFGYFDKVYTDLGSLFSVIGISMETINESWEEKFKAFTDFSSSAEVALNEVNEFIKEHKIATLLELKKRNQHLHWLVIKYELTKKLDFSNLYTLDEVIQIIKENKIPNYTVLYKKFKGAHKTIRLNNWEDKISFFKE